MKSFVVPASQSPRSSHTANAVVLSHHTIAASSLSQGGSGWLIIDAPIHTTTLKLELPHFVVKISRKYGLLSKTHMVRFRSFLDDHGREHVPVHGFQLGAAIRLNVRDGVKHTIIRLRTYPWKMDDWRYQMRYVRLVVMEKKLFNDIKAEEMAQKTLLKTQGLHGETFEDMFDSWFRDNGFEDIYIRDFALEVLRHEIHSAKPLLQLTLFDMFNNRHNVPALNFGTTKPSASLIRAICCDSSNAKELVLNALRMMDHHLIIPLLMQHQCTFRTLSSLKSQGHYGAVLQWLTDLVKKNRFIPIWEAQYLIGFNFWIRPGYDVEKCAEDRREATKTVFRVGLNLKDELKQKNALEAQMLAIVKDWVEISVCIYIMHTHTYTHTYTIHTNGP